MSKSTRTRLAITAAAAATVLICLHLHRGSVPETATTFTNRPLVDAIARAREQIRAARAEVRAHRPAHAIVLPPNPPPLGLPSWLRRMPSQPDQGVPTPRGTP